MEQQQVLERDKRSIIPDFVGIEHPKAVTIQDPLYKDQWYLVSNFFQTTFRLLCYFMLNQMSVYKV